MYHLLTHTPFPMLALLAGFIAFLAVTLALFVIFEPSTQRHTNIVIVIGLVVGVAATVSLFLFSPAAQDDHHDNTEAATSSLTNSILQLYS